MRSLVVNSSEGAHPALAAVSRLGLRIPEASHIEALEEGKKSAVYRISWPDSPAGSIVVKRCTVGLGETERLLYGRILPELQVTSLQCYGSWENNETVWLALEDAGDTEPSLDAPESRALLTEWIATLHLEGARLSGDDLPNRGCDHFAQRLRGARAELVSRLRADGLDADDHKILERAVERCDRLAAVWPRIEAICQRFPRTLVHGDFVEENLRVTMVDGHPRLLPLDWEKAGWGAPAVDLVRVEPDRYFERTRTWLDCSRAELSELVLVGRIFRVLVHQWAGKSIGKAERADARLARLLVEARWEAGL